MSDRLEVDNILQELEDMGEKIFSQMNTIQYFLKGHTGLDANLFANLEFSENKSLLRLKIVFYNRQIAEYVFWLSDNNLYRAMSNLNDYNTNNEYMPVKPMVEKFENKMQELYDCHIEHIDMQ